MAFPQSVRRLQTFGIPGELYGNKHTFTYTYNLRANGELLPTYGRVFTMASGDPTSATIGGTNAFAGILAFPKEAVLRGGLTPSMEVQDYSQGALLGFGQLIVTAKNSITAGMIAAFDTDTGEIYGYASNSVIPAVAAFGTVSLEAGNPSANDTVTIGAKTYKFVETLAAANDVLIGDASTDTAANLNAAINGGAGEGTVYGTGTTANASVTSVVDGSVVTCTAKVSGTTGNSIALSKSGTNINITAFSGGVDATNTLPEGQTQIPNAKFVLFNASAGEEAVLQLGA